MVFIVGVAVDDAVGGEQERALVPWLLFHPVAAKAIRSSHLNVDALGIIDGDVVGVGVAAFGPVVVKVSARRTGEVPQMDREESLGGQCSRPTGFSKVEYAGIRQVENKVEFDIGGLLSGKDPISIRHIARVFGICCFLLQLTKVISRIAGLLHIRRIDGFLLGLPVLKHIETEHVIGFTALRLLTFKIGLLRVKIIFRSPDVADIFVRNLPRHKVAPLGQFAGLPITRGNRADVCRIVSNPEFDLGVQFDKRDTIGLVVVGLAWIGSPYHFSSVDRSQCALH